MLMRIILLGFIMQLFSSCITQRFVYVHDTEKNMLTEVSLQVQTPSLMGKPAITDLEGKAIVVKIRGANLIRVAKDGYKTQYVPFPDAWPLYVTMNRCGICQE